MEGQVGLFDQDSWFGKTCQEHSAAEPLKEQTLRRSSKKSSKSQSQKPVCKCVYQTEDGQNLGAITLRMVDGPLLGDFMMPSFGEQPNMLMTECSFGELHNGVSVSRLSQILVDSPLQKYCLSARACDGILRRAERRGKELPKELREALEQQSAKNGNQKEIVCKSCGETFTSNDEINGLAPAECPKCGEENDLEYLCDVAESSVNSSVAGTLDASYYKGCGERNGVERDVVVSKYHSPVYPINTMVGTRDTAETRTTFGVGKDGDPQFTISAAHEHAVMTAGFKAGQSKDGGLGYAEEQSPTLSATPSALEPTVVTSGNNAESYCLQGNLIDRATAMNGTGVCKNISATLNSTDRHGVAYES